MQEIIGREDARDDHVAALGRFRAEIAEPDADDQEHPEELLVERPEAGRAHLRGVEPRQEGKHGDRAEERQNAHELVRDRAQDRVERQEVPFRHDVRRRLQRIGGNVVVGMAEIVRDVEHEPGEQNHEADEGEIVLRGRVWRERHRIAVRLHVDTERVALPDVMQRPDVQDHHADDHKRQQIMQREEALQRRLVDRIAAPQPLGDRPPETGNGRE